MAMKTRTLFLVFVCAVVLVSSAMAAKDPELKQCKQQCKQQRQFDEHQKEQCKKECEKQSEEREAGGDIEFWSNQEQQQQQETSNPYVFDDRHFATAEVETGRFRNLQKFTERSNLLQGLENYRLGNIQLHPLTFVLPHHFDANVITVAIQGRGSLTFNRQDKRETILLERGDILRVPAGTTAYGTNRDNSENFATVTLTMPVGISGPGNSEVFVGAGGELPESFFRSFSSELLEAAFNTRRDRLERLFGTQKQGFVVQATEEQIKALTNEGGSGFWPFGGRSEDGPYNILKKHPTHYSQYGILQEVNGNDYKGLQDLNLAVSYVNLTKGSMELPYYNSKATEITYVVKGEGYMEMICPHLSQEQGQSQSQYHRVSTPLRSGIVVVSPPGHPIIAVASEHQNLEVLSFYVNGKDNVKVPYAGEQNIVNQFVKEAKELAFAIPAKDVEDIFKSQKEHIFSKGPNGQQPRGARASI